MTRGLWLALLVLVACDAKPVAPPGAPGVPGAKGLRIPLPDGWVAASTSSERLTVGPRGRAVVSLEPRAGQLPTEKAVEAALRQAGLDAGVTTRDRFVGARYPLDVTTQATGFIGFRDVGSRTLWCASVGQTSEAEAAEALELCAGASWDAQAR